MASFHSHCKKAQYEEQCLWSCTEISLWYTKGREVLMDLTDCINLCEFRWTSLLFVKYSQWYWTLCNTLRLLHRWRAMNSHLCWKAANRTDTGQRLRFLRKQIQGGSTQWDKRGWTGADRNTRAWNSTDGSECHLTSHSLFSVYSQVHIFTTVC